MMAATAAAPPEAFLVPPPPPHPPHPPHPPPPPSSTTPKPRNGFRTSTGGGGGGGKRRGSCGAKHPAWKRRRRAASECGPVLPSEFLLGGNIFDPLNLNSLLDEEVSRALNARTPQSSPLPARGRDPVEILVPRDITDPLSLNEGGDGEALGPKLASPAKSGRRRHRHRGQQRGNNVGNNAGNNSGNNNGNNNEEPTGRHRKRRRTCSKSEGPRPPQSHEKPPEKNPEKRKSPEKNQNKTKPTPNHQKLPTEKTKPSTGKTPKFKQRKFQYGNYCKYYGYRNPDVEDPRLRVLKGEWFEGKDVLDVGCNVGHLTLSIAKRWAPKRIVGLDIDARLVRSARQNIRHYLSETLGGDEEEEEEKEEEEKKVEGREKIEKKKKKGFPAALAASRGPIAAPQLPPEGPEKEEFPHNVVFVTGNYVPEREELVRAQPPEFDVLLLLSLTKWVQLNWGDEGLKRLFRRAFRHLRPGGLLVLEPQPWGSYHKRKGLTETTFRNYHRIRLRPEQFPTYLTSPEVGFERWELLGTPQHSSKGFQRPIYLFHKGRGDAP